MEEKPMGHMLPGQLQLAEDYFHSIKFATRIFAIQKLKYVYIYIYMVTGLFHARSLRRQLG